jgi:hypothetical protein
VEEIQHVLPQLFCLTVVGFVPFGKQDFDRSELIESFANLIRLQPLLRSLSMDLKLFTSVVPHLPLLHHVEELHLDARSLDEDSPQSSYASVSTLLPVLRKLSGDIEFGGKEFWALFLPMTAHRITQITLCDGCPQYISAAEALELFIVVGKSCPHLESFVVDRMEHEMEGPGSLVGLFRPLLECPMLMKLEVSTSTFDICLTIHDADVEEMAKTWTHLEILRLSARHALKTTELDQPTMTWLSISRLIF